MKSFALAAPRFLIKDQSSLKSTKRASSHQRDQKACFFQIFHVVIDSLQGKPSVR
jgi:hypothetical protein